MKIIGFVLLLWICNVRSDQKEETYGGYPFWEDWKPSRYSLDISMKIEEDSFFGEVRITGTVLKQTNNLGLHSKVNISEGFYSIKGNKRQLDLNLASIHDASGVIVFKLDQIIRKDVEFMLTLKYSGNMHELKGLYMSFYEFNNEKRKVISTEFQPMGARLVFPCIDIPSYKAVFEIKVGRPQSMKALSNMPIRNTSAPDPKINGQVWDTFHPTPKMSTYNVAFVIFDELASIELPKNITIWFPEASREHVLFPSEIMGVLLEAMENYTGIDYKLPKMDFVLVPNKEFVAMESWGLITWGHRFLFLKNEKYSFEDELTFVLYMAHEIAHQWFGNLVTCKYWCYLWLNEGITSYLMNLNVDQLFPESKAMELFVSINMESGIFEDFHVPFSLVEKQFCHNKISTYTTSLKTYLKGSAITNMVANIIMNSGSFRQGLQTYLMENQFGSVTEKELWGALQTKMDKRSIPGGESLESLMHGWTHNYGFPLLTVYRHKNGSLTVKQIVTLLIGISSAKSSSDQIENTNIEYPFWKYWKPSYYSLEIAPNIKEKSFSGEVRITGTILENTDKLGLHSKVNISNGFYSIKDKNTQLDLNSASKNYTSGVIVFKLDQIIKKDVEFVLTLKYSGQMQQLKGLYISFFDEKRKVISTEFQPMGARLVFPCIDIPSYKAVFEIKVGRPQSMKALSNMPVRSTSAPDPKINGQVWETFYPSPKMSTYLVAFVIFDDMASKKLTKNITIWYPEEGKEQLQLAFDNMDVLLDAIENYTGMSYHLPKMDILMVPRKVALAMENWGLITWGYEHLMQKNEMTHFNEIVFVHSMAHEILHQWFGNLVTCKYWCYIWLNEGIVTYLMYLIVDKVYPELKVKDAFLPYFTDIIMSADFVTPSPAVEHNYCRNDISQYSITSKHYFKGATITNMVVDTLMNGDSFRQGLQTYLIENQFGSVTEKEFWGALQTKMDKRSIPDGESLESLMYGWTHNFGFPLLTVYRHKNGSLTVKQEPFDIQRKNKDVKSYWWIPVTYTTSKERDFENVHLKEWLRPTNEVQPLTVNITDDEWIILNLQNIGYYKVNYDKRTWELITTHLMSDNMAQIHPLSRAQLITDSFFLAKTGILNYSTFLNLSRYLQNEFHYIPLEIGLNTTESLLYDSENTRVFDSLKGYFKYIVHNVYKYFMSSDFKITNFTSHKAKMTIIKYGCLLNLQHCKNQTKQLLDDIMNNKFDEKQLNSELRYSFWCTASKIGDGKVFNYIKQKYIEEKQSSIKDEYLHALYCVKNETVFISFVKDILDKADYLKENIWTDLFIDVIFVDTSCLIIDYFSKNFNSLKLRYGNALMEHLKTLVSIPELKKNCKDKLKKLLAQKCINLTIIENPPWDEKYVAEISSWFKSGAVNFEIKENDTYVGDTNIFIDDNLNFFKVMN